MRVASVVVLVSQSTLLTPPTPPTPLDTLDTRHSTPSTPRQHQSIPDVKIAFDTPLTPSTPSTLVSTDTPSTPPRHSVDTVDIVDTSTHQGSIREQLVIALGMDSALARAEASRGPVGAPGTAFVRHDPGQADVLERAILRSCAGAPLRTSSNTSLNLKQKHPTSCSFSV